MKENDFLGKSIMGILVGTFLACIVLMITKHDDYMRFWNYIGFFIFPLMNFFIFMLAFSIYAVLNKLFKPFIIFDKGFFIVSFFFGFFYLLGEAYVINPLITMLGRNLGFSFLFYLTDPGIPYLFFPILLFFIILITHNTLRPREYKEK